MFFLRLQSGTREEPKWSETAEQFTSEDEAREFGSLMVRQDAADFAKYGCGVQSYRIEDENGDELP